MQRPRLSLRYGLALGLVMLASLGFAQDVKYTKYKLANGMTVILHEDHSLPTATINIWYRVGSKDEPPRRSGFAHLYEHLMFMGTKRVPTGQFDQIMERAGGNNNASTAEDRTNYFSVGPSNLLPTLLWLDADRLEDLGAAMDKKKVDLQRDVVKNERRQNVENIPGGRADETINATMFPPGHPYDHSVIGSMEDLDNASVQDVKDFFSTYYVPNNASLVVAGDFDPKVIRPLIDKWYGSLPRRSDPPRLHVPAVGLTGVIRRSFTDKVQTPKLVMVWHSPAAYTPGDAEMDITSSVLTNGVTSRLYDRLVTKDKLATEVTSYQASKTLGSLFQINATAAEGVDLAKVEAAIDDELAKFAKKGPTPSEAKRVVSQLEYGILNNLQSINQKADMLNMYEFYFGEPNSFKRVLDAYRNASPSAIQKVAAKTLDLDKRLILHVLPESQTVAGTNPRDDKPTLDAESAFTAPAPKEFTLSNGLRVEYFSRPELPLMSVNLQFRSGAEADPAGKIGRAQMTAAMLDQGAGTRDARAFEEALTSIGASVRAGAGEQQTFISLDVIASQFTTGLSLLSDAVLRPKFDATEYARVQRLTLANLEEENDNPRAVATKVGNREFFGPNHPYGTPVSGTPETVKALTPEDLKASHAQTFQPQNATLFVAGSLSEEEVKAQLEKAFGKWQGTRQPLPKVEYPEPAQGFRVLIVDRPEAVQTVIRFMFPAPAYADPMRETLSSVSTLLGGGFTSRLNQNLREDKGYTYGAGSSYIATPKVGYFIASSSVRADVTGASIKEFLSEFKRINAGDITDVEAGKAASSRRADLVQSLSGLSGVLATAAGYEQNGRPFTALNEDIKSLSSISAAQLNAMGKSVATLDRGLLVLVGDKATILKQLEGLGLPAAIEVKAK